MTPDEIFEAYKAEDWPKINAWMAEFMGWVVDDRSLDGWRTPDGYYGIPPDYCSSHDAVHEAQERLDVVQWADYIDELRDMLGLCTEQLSDIDNERAILSAPAAICCVAMLRAVLTKGNSHDHQ